jgi:hypothetical protein
MVKLGELQKVVQSMSSDETLAVDTGGETPRQLNYRQSWQVALMIWRCENGHKLSSRLPQWAKKFQGEEEGLLRTILLAEVSEAQAKIAEAVKSLDGGLSPVFCKE